MKTGDYLGGIIIVLCCSVLWYRVGILYDHTERLARAYQQLQFQVDVLTERIK